MKVSSHIVSSHNSSTIAICIKAIFKIGLQNIFISGFKRPNLRTTLQSFTNSVASHNNCQMKVSCINLLMLKWLMNGNYIVDGFAIELEATLERHQFTYARSRSCFLTYSHVCQAYNFLFIVRLLTNDGAWIDNLLFEANAMFDEQKWCPNEFDEAMLILWFVF